MASRSRGRTTDSTYRCNLLSTLALLLVVPVLQPPKAHAEWLGLTGAEIAEDARYAYLGVIHTEGEPLNGDWVQRFWLDWLEYSYDADQTSVSVTAPGVEYALGYRSVGSLGWAGILAAIQYRSADLFPPQPESRVNEHSWRFGLHLEGESHLGNKWRLGGNVSVYAPIENYWIRTRLLRNIGRDLHLGAELIALGGPEYGVQQIGAVLEGRPLRGAMVLAVKAGVRRSDEDTGAYGGLEISRIF